MKRIRYDLFRSEFLHAELAGELTEFQAFNLHAVVTMTEGAELVSDYLEMAEAVAASCEEFAIAAEMRAVYDSLCRDPASAARRCLAVLMSRSQSQGMYGRMVSMLWNLEAQDADEAAPECLFYRRCEHDDKLDEVGGRLLMRQLEQRYISCDTLGLGAPPLALAETKLSA